MRGVRPLSPGHSPVVPTSHHFDKNTDLRIDYRPVDHYALTAMGATNYVVLIENDATNRPPA